MNYDIAILGLGPSGLRFAREALKAGLNVIAFEKASVGGTCLNLGCVPTKTILASTEVFSKLSCCQKFGIKSFDQKPLFSYENMCQKKDKVVEKLKAAIVKDLENKGLAIVYAEAKIKIDKNIASLIADGIEYKAVKIIAATGSKPMEIKGLEFDSKSILTSDDVLNLYSLPKSLLIIGSGAIGVEWARIFNTLNVDVTVVEKAPVLLPVADIDVSARVERMFKIAKIKFFNNAFVTDYTDGIATLSNGTKIACEKILVAAGRKKVYPKFCTDFELRVNKDCTTNIDNLYVIGDASGAPMLAHVASYQAYSLFGSLYLNKPYHMPPSPSVIYGTPEIASIGTREQDIDSKDDYKICKLPVSYLPKAWCDDEIDGFIKIITHFDKIAGAHIVSKEASALIMQIAIAMKGNLGVEDIKEVIFAHPTYSEGIIEAICNG